MRLLVHDEHETTIEVPQDELYGMSADQILTSPTFALESTRPQAFVDVLKQVEK